MISVLQEEKQKRMGPGGLDPVEVYESLPQVCVHKVYNTAILYYYKITWGLPYYPYQPEENPYGSFLRAYTGVEQKHYVTTVFHFFLCTITRKLHVMGRY